jgi:putative heme-binding domain-containing protein
MFDLVRLLTSRSGSELRTIRSELEGMARTAQRPLTRQLGFVALVAADGSADPAWALATKSAAALRDLVQAMPLVRDPGLRASLYPKVQPLLSGLPHELTGSAAGDVAAIRQGAMTALTSVRGQEEPTFKALAHFVRDGTDRHAAVQAILRIPTAYWPKDEARPLLDSIVTYVRGTPAQERTTPAVVDALQLGDALTALLPADAAKSIRQELNSLGVRVIRIGTVTDQMLFDKERVVVQAGRQVEFVLENTDLMPHNFVITQPGALQEIGTLAEAQATQPGAQERHYVPPSDKVLAASRLLQPRDAQRLRFTAPAQPGVYPYVCTYPGHWLRMHGALYVVQDLDDYLADPEGYLVRHPLRVADELLKFNRPRKEWSIAELTPSVEQLAGGRSFANGKQMFQVAACVACHKLGGVGQEFGPDLTKLDPKQQTPAEILRDIVDPSFRINEKYQTWAIETQAGKVITGLIMGETPTEVKVVENPQISTTPIVLRPGDIVKREKAPNSIMPKGLLDKLTMDEILDLIAYVAAGGDANHKLFQGAHDQGHGGHH